MTREPDWLCPFCGTGHQRKVCTQFLQTLPVVTGTMGPNREYIPPPGVSVTVRVLPSGVGGSEAIRAYGRGYNFGKEQEDA